MTDAINSHSRRMYNAQKNTRSDLSNPQQKIDMKTEHNNGGPAPSIRVDVWGGDLHQRLVKTGQFDGFSDAAEFMRVRVDAGLLCNVLHTDFACPEHKVEAQKVAISEQYLDLATPLDDPLVLALVEATKNLTDIAHKHTFGKAGILDVHAAVKNTRAALSALEG